MSKREKKFITNHVKAPKNFGESFGKCSERVTSHAYTFVMAWPIWAYARCCGMFTRERGAFEVAGGNQNRVELEQVLHLIISALVLRVGSRGYMC